MPTTIHRINHIPIQLPERLVLSRMGCNHHLTVINAQQETYFATLMAEAFALCHPRGVWRELRIANRDESTIILEDGSRFHSQALAKLLITSTSVWLAATSIGGDLTLSAKQKCADADGTAALVYDAVGGETADAAMDWVQQFCTRELMRQRRTLSSRRFSPGYSDLDLSEQRTIFTLLDLESWGLQLTESFMMLPEKSVTAIAGIDEQN